MFTLHCTKKLLGRIKHPVEAEPFEPTTTLGNWYATALFFKPQLALLVNERTLLPVLMPLAPATTMANRFPEHLAAVLATLGTGRTFIDREIAAMAEVRFAKTANRSVVGIINEFSFLAGLRIGYDRDDDSAIDPLATSIRLADTPCSPMKYNSPARLLKEISGGAQA
jgi:hypothetical protein